MRRAERAAPRQEHDIRRAYVDVLDAVTGGKLILLTDEELARHWADRRRSHTGLRASRPVRGAERARGGRRNGVPGWAPSTDIRTPVCEASSTRSTTPEAARTSSSPATTCCRSSSVTTARASISALCRGRRSSAVSRPRPASAWDSLSCCRAASASCSPRAPGARPSCSSSRPERWALSRWGSRRPSGRRACGLWPWAPRAWRTGVQDRAVTSATNSLKAAR